MREIFSEHTNEHLRSFVALVHAQASAGDSSEAAGKALSFGWNLLDLDWLHVRRVLGVRNLV